MSDPILEGMARLAAQRIVETYVPQAYSYGLNKAQIKWMFKRVLELAAEIIDKQPS